MAPFADVVINVSGSGYAGSDRLESSVELATINVIARYRHAGLGSGGFHFSRTLCGLPAGR